MVYQDALG